MDDWIQTRLESITGLPTLPTILQRFNDKASDPNTRLGDLVGIICDDPAIFANVLRLCNSSLYAAGTGVFIDSIETAIVRLGFARTRNVVYTTSLLRTFKSVQHRDFDLPEFWMHSLATAAIAQIVLDRSPRTAETGLDSSKLHLAALMHDLGKIILQEYFNDSLQEILQHARRYTTSLLAAEQAILGTDHAEIGGWLVGHWTPDPVLREAVRWHHDPLHAEEAHRDIAALVHTANYLCHRKVIGHSGNRTPSFLKDECWRHLRLNEALIAQMLKEIDTRKVRENTAFFLKA